MSRLFIAEWFSAPFSSRVILLFCQVAALGVFGYATFSIIAGCLGDYRKPPNLVVMVTGIISIVQVEWSRPSPSFIQLWSAQYKANTIVGADNRILSRRLNICEHKVITLNIFLFSISAVWGVLTIYRTFTDNSWQNLLTHCRSFSSFCSSRTLLGGESLVQIRYQSSMNIKLWLKYQYQLFRTAQSQAGRL